VNSVPEHLLDAVTDAAHACARTWQEFAAQLESRETMN
jgi:hypothetical protein